MKKPAGWRREPARHALASKGVRTRQDMKQQNASRGTLKLPATAMRSSNPTITDDQKEAAVDQVLAAALSEGGSKERAIELLEDPEWVDSAATKAAEDQAGGWLKRGSLKQEVIRALQKSPLQSEPEEG